MKKYKYKVVKAMRHRGQPYKVGAELEMTLDEAHYHRKFGNVELVEKSPSPETSAPKKATKGKESK